MSVSLRVFRSDEMVEALSTSFQNFYNKYTRSEITDNERCADRREIYIVPVNAADEDPSTLHQRYRPKSRKAFVFDVKNLCQVKESVWQVIRQKRMRPVVGPCCMVCVPVRFLFVYRSILNSLMSTPRGNSLETPIEYTQIIDNTHSHLQLIRINWVLFIVD